MDIFMDWKVEFADRQMPNTVGRAPRPGPDPCIRRCCKGLLVLYAGMTVFNSMRRMNNPQGAVDVHGPGV